MKLRATITFNYEMANGKLPPQQFFDSEEEWWAELIEAEIGEKAAVTVEQVREDSA